MANATMAITIKARDLATKVIRGAGGAVKGMTRNLFSLKGAMALLAGGFGSFKFSQEFIEANSTLEQMKFRMDALLGSAERGEKAFEFIRKFQRENPIGSIKEMSTAFEGLVVAGINPATGALKDLLAASRKFGLTEDDVKGVTIALRQMSSKSNLQAEEMGQLAERLPGIYKKVAEEFGITQDQFMTKMKRRLIGGQEAVSAVLRVMNKEGQGVIEEYLKTWPAKMTQLKSIWFEILTDIGKTGAFEKIKKTLDSIIKLITKNKPIIIGFFDSIGNRFIDTVNNAIDFINKQDFVDNAKKVFKIFNELVGVVSKVGIGMALVTAKAINLFFTIENQMKKILRLPYNLGVIDPFKRQADEVKRLSAEWDVFANKVSGLEARVRDTSNPKEAAALNVVFKRERDKLDEKLKELQAKQAILKKLRKDFEGENFAFKDKKDPILTESLENSLSSVDDMTKKANDKIDKIVPVVVEKLKKGASAIKGAVDAGTNDMGLVDPKEDNAKTSKTKAQSFFEGWDEALKKTKERYDFFMDDMAKTGKFMAETVTGALSTQFNDFFTDLIDGKMKSFKDAILGFLKDIARAMSQAFSQKLSAQIVGGLGDVAKSLFPSSSVPASSTSSVTPRPGLTLGYTPPRQKSQKVEIINNTNEPVQASKATVRQDVSGQIMSIVIDSVRTNKGGSRQALKASLM